jgi:hypothetical protein
MRFSVHTRFVFAVGMVFVIALTIPAVMTWANRDLAAPNSPPISQTQLLLVYKGGRQLLGADPLDARRLRRVGLDRQRATLLRRPRGDWTVGSESVPAVGKPTATARRLSAAGLRLLYVTPITTTAAYFLPQKLVARTREPRPNNWRYPEPRDSRNGLSGRNVGLFWDTGCLAVPGVPSIVGTGDIFGHRLTQPIHAPLCGVRLSRRD